MYSIFCLFLVLLRITAGQLTDSEIQACGPEITDNEDQIRTQRRCIEEYRNEHCKSEGVFKGYSECFDNCRPSCLEYLTNVTFQCENHCLSGCECLDGYLREGFYCVSQDFCNSLIAVGNRKIYTQLEQLQKKRDIFFKLVKPEPPHPKQFLGDTPGVKQTGYYKKPEESGSGNSTTESGATTTKSGDGTTAKPPAKTTTGQTVD